MKIAKFILSFLILSLNNLLFCAGVEISPKQVYEALRLSNTVNPSANDILGLSKRDSEDDIKKKHTILIEQWNPNHAPSHKKHLYEAVLKEINNAYEQLIKRHEQTVHETKTTHEHHAPKTHEEQKYSKELLDVLHDPKFYSIDIEKLKKSNPTLSKQLEEFDNKLSDILSYTNMDYQKFENILKDLTNNKTLTSLSPYVIQLIYAEIYTLISAFLNGSDSKENIKLKYLIALVCDYINPHFIQDTIEEINSGALHISDKESVLKELNELQKEYKEYQEYHKERRKTVDEELEKHLQYIPGLGESVHTYNVYYNSFFDFIKNKKILPEH